MAWTAPRTWVNGELETEDIFNTHVRDNLLALRPDACVVKRTSNQTISNNTETSLLFDTDREDENGMHSIVSNTNRINLLKYGVWLIIANRITFTAHETGNDFCWIKYYNGSTFCGGVANGGTGLDNSLDISALVLGGGTDKWVEVTVKQTSGGDLDITYDASGTSPQFSAILLKDLST